MDTNMIAEIICRLTVCAALFILSMEDIKRYEIPPACTAVIFACGIWNLWLERPGWTNCLIGLCCISLPLALLEGVSKGNAVGGGDVKLMAAAGFLLGWKKCLLAFALACIVGSVIHSARMKWRGASRVLAFGPYLSLGIFIAMWWGDVLIDWYMAEWFAAWLTE